MRSEMFWPWALRGLNGIVNMLTKEKAAGTPIEAADLKTLETEVARLQELLEAMRIPGREKPDQGA